ncbi:hypothetical protein BKA62DRAFT_672395 [Auriculariales sp. MPI-PUGE-AT-0066]|nr:hypothetical protein BKA62DRAFT_672395 [Auriculariales sp. MPI-PUGE-AT-0066]
MVTAVPRTYLNTSSPAVPAIRNLYTFTDGSFLENVAVRGNGDLVITSLSHPRIITVDPRAANPTPRTLSVISSPTVNVTTGIVEFAPDQFAVLGSLFSLKTFIASNFADIPEAILCNGLVTLPHAAGQVLVADSGKGALWRVDINTGAVALVVEDPILASNLTNLPLGINGIHIHNDELYFTNTGRGYLGRVPIAYDGVFTGNITTLATIPTGIASGASFDDFAMDSKGRFWISTHSDIVDLVLPDDSQQILRGFNVSATPGTGPTAAVFGRGCESEEETLYVVSGEGAIFAVNTTAILESSK